MKKSANNWFKISIDGMFGKYTLILSAQDEEKAVEHALNDVLVHGAEKMLSKPTKCSKSLAKGVKPYADTPFTTAYRIFA